MALGSSVSSKMLDPGRGLKSVSTVILFKYDVFSPVLHEVKEAQLAHGLRHGDYQLYRQYCSRRLRRLRKKLDLIQGDKKNFRKKVVNVDILKDDR